MTGAGGRSEQQRLGRTDTLLILLLALACFLPGFFTLPPFDRDESRYVQATKQMVESGDYMDIRFQDAPRHKKPIGIYWLQSAAVELSGRGTAAPLWVYRLVSLAGALASVLGTAWLGARLFGRPAGFIAGLGLAATLLLGVEARLAKTDAMLLATILAMQAGLAGTYLRHRRGEAPGWGAALLFWSALGLGTLIKGPVAPVVAGLTGLCLMLADRDWRWPFKLKPLVGLPLAAAIVLPWFVAITLDSGGGFLRDSFGQDIFGKIFEGQESHGALPGYYLTLFWVIAWPFGPALLVALLFAWRHRSEPAVRFLLAWILPTWLLFELIMTKLPHYLLPVFPALFLLLGWSFAAVADKSLPVGRQVLLLRLGQGLFLIVSILLAVAAAVLIGEGGGDWVWAAPVLAGVVLAVWGGLRPFALRDEPQRLKALLAGAVLVYVGFYQGILPSLQRIWLAPRVVAAMEGALPGCSDPQLVSSGYREPSLVFLAGTKTALVRPPEAAVLLAEDPVCRLALVDAQQEAAFKQALPAKANLREVAVLEGFNYAGGDSLQLTLYALAP